MSDWKNVQYKDGKLRTNNGGSGGSSTFAGLDDVNFSNLADGQIPKYDSQSQKWVNANESGGGGGHTYSTTEQVIGTWIDGKPLYEKTVTFGTVPAGSVNYLIDFTILTVDNLINIDCIAYSSNSYFRLPVPLLQSEALFAEWGINMQAFDKSTGKLRIDTGSSRTLSGGYVTIKYTKTTD